MTGFSVSAGNPNTTATYYGRRKSLRGQAAHSVLGGKRRKKSGKSTRKPAVKVAIKVKGKPDAVLRAVSKIARGSKEANERTSI